MWQECILPQGLLSVISSRAAPPSAQQQQDAGKQDVDGDTNMEGEGGGNEGEGRAEHLTVLKAKFIMCSLLPFLPPPPTTHYPPPITQPRPLPLPVSPSSLHRITPLCLAPFLLHHFPWTAVKIWRSAIYFFLMSLTFRI